MEVEMFKLSNSVFYLILVAFALPMLADDCPVLKGTLPTATQSWSVDVKSGIAYVGEDAGGLKIVDVSNPASPALLGSVGSYPGRDVVVAYPYAYQGENGSFLHVIDVTDPTAPFEVGSVPAGGSIYGLAISGHFVYAGTANWKLQIFDVSTPSSPFLAGQLDLGDYGYGVAVSGSLVYVAAGNHGLRIIDVSDPTAPYEVGGVSSVNQTDGIALYGTYAVVSCWNFALEIVDVSNPAAPFYVYQGSLPSEGERVAVIGDLALIADSNAGLVVYNIADPSAPSQVGIVDTIYGLDVKAAGTTAYLADSDGGLKTFDLRGCPGAPAPDIFIPASAKAAGAGGTNWKTDAVLHNPGAVMASANLYFLEAGADNSGAPPHAVTVPAGTSLKLTDIVGTLFGRTNAAGAIRIQTSAVLMASSRTYNDQGSAGTYGQAIKGYPVSAGLTSSTGGRLIQLSKNAAYRTNIGFANAQGTPIQVTVDAYRGTGEYLGALTYPLPPFGYYQEGNVLQYLTSDDLDDAFIMVSSPTAGAVFFAYASIVDNRTGDPTYIEPQ